MTPPGERIRVELDAGASFAGSQPNRLFLQDEDGFVDLSGVSGLDSFGDGRAWAWSDLDRDGRPDVVVVSANAPLLQVFNNQMEGAGSVLAVRLVGEGANRDGIGAKVVVKTAAGRLAQERRAGEGFASQNSATLLFGLGEQTGTESVTVSWPSGKRTSVRFVRAGTLLTLHEDGAVEKEPWVRP